MDKKPLCIIPWTNIDINPRGYISPCCKVKYKSRDEYDNLTKDSFHDYLENPTLNHIKKTLLDGEWPEECIRCKLDEESGVPSKRQLDNQRWAEKFDTYNETDGFLTISVAFDNVCNLKCIMCSPMSSSKWREEYNLIYSTAYDKVGNYVDGYIDELISMSPNVIHFDIHGGEPFLSKSAEQKKLLAHYVETGKSKNITLHYITNATIFPDDEWWELWGNFKHVEIQMSLDAHGKRYNYIRFPGNWDVVKENIKLYMIAEYKNDNISLAISHTVSAYNIYYLDEFYSWCVDFGLPKPYLGRAHQPVHMQPEVWCDEAKLEIKNILGSSDYAEVRQWANVMDNASMGFDQFLHYMKKHDEYRNLKFSEYFPEMDRFIQHK